MKLLLLSVFLASFLAIPDSSESSTDVAAASDRVYASPEDGLLNMFFLVSKYGYPIETHSIQTADGYILKTYRIPHGRKCKVADKNKKPILIVHGLLCSSYDFVISGPSDALAYILADECYDVWLANNRGNSESVKHVNYTTGDYKFWDFSWHEMGVYDVPAMVDYILKKTKQPSLHYIGYSQGTTQFFVYNSMIPDSSQKIRSMHALAPVAYLRDMPSFLLRIIAPFERPLKVVGDLLRILDMGSVSKFFNLLGILLCGESDTFKIGAVTEVCFNIPFFIAGFDHTQLNRTLLPAYFGHTPAGCSTKQLNHFGQCVNSGQFRQYDYGYAKNLEIYNSPIPPKYNLKNATAPIAMYYAENDWLAAVSDYRNLAKQLPNVISHYKVPYPKFNHLDFVWAIDAKTLVYNKLLEVLKRFP